ncbi:N-acetylglucosaminyl phosphatidylinositol deacetylase protein [Rutstroemia sp. NJR-2017a BVV2]|nr:N-acetylglucosaminyl phosphatidylinositol deacetylase protein [Rutstroemia sp. NJR-2017a BVV2]PQE18384.1 N-acetylglucosaminyl phosphatidylinositol deacetylase protein [Rutstroemia sp. NJR-2017a BVV2]
MMKPSPNITRRHRRKISLIIRNRKIRRCFLLLSTIIFVFPLSLYFTLAYVINQDPRILPPALKETKNVLFVTARPGAESLWLAPTVRGVLRPGEKNPGGRIGGLLVLADGEGNRGGEAERRRKAEEMRRSCLVLGIAEERCVVLRGEQLNDDPVLQWSEHAVEEALEMYVKKWNIDLIVTLDQGVISPYTDHRALSSAIQTYASTNIHAPTTYVLKSVSSPRKYISLLDLPLTSISFTWRMFRALTSSIDAHDRSYSQRALLVNTWHSYIMSRKALASYSSHHSWDRDFVYMFSRNLWINELKLVERESGV